MRTPLWPEIRCGLLRPRRFRRRFLLLCGSFGLIGFAAAAQDVPAITAASEQSAPAKTTESSATPAPAQQTSQTATAQATNNKKESRGAIVAAPIPISSPALGSGVVLVGGYIFPLQKSDKESFPSTVGAAVLITDNGSRAWALGGEFYARQNTYHITTIYFRGNLNYDFYGIGTDAGNAGLKLPLKQTGEVFLGDFLYRFKWKIFAGPRLLTGNSTLTLRPTNNPAVPPPPGIGIQTTLTGLGFHLSRDTRPNKFYPTAGSLLDFTSLFFADGLGSKYTFQSYRFTFNRYWGLGSKQVLAYNLFTCGTGGDPPFYGECLYGTNNQLRGYVAGQYIDRTMFATQLEYRLGLPWRLGMVVFGGLGEVASSVGEFQASNLLPGGGGGLRFMLSKKYNVNLRADIAQGKSGHTFSMGIGEAF